MVNAYQLGLSIIIFIISILHAVFYERIRIFYETNGYTFLPRTDEGIMFLGIFGAIIAIFLGVKAFW